MAKYVNINMQRIYIYCMVWDVSTMTVYIDNAAAVMFSVVL